MKQLLIFAITILISLTVIAQEPNPPAEKAGASAQQLADKLSNPVAKLISVPMQENIDWGIGDANGSKSTLNVQPVIPIKLSSRWNLITRCAL